MSSLTTGSRRKLVGLEQVLRKRDRHRWVYVGGKWIATHRAALQIPVGDQARFDLGFLVVKVGDPLFPDIASVVDGVLSLFVRVFKLIERLLVFHGLSLRRSNRHQAPRISNAPAARVGPSWREGASNQAQRKPEEVS
jgi:hypothetical protein